MTPLGRLTLRNSGAGKEAGATGSAEGPLQGLVSPEAEERLQGTPELDYLTHIVMRLFENKRCASLASAALLDRVGLGGSHAAWQQS